MHPKKCDFRPLFRREEGKGFKEKSSNMFYVLGEKLLFDDQTFCIFVVIFDDIHLFFVLSAEVGCMSDTASRLKQKKEVWGAKITTKTMYIYIVVA